METVDSYLYTYTHSYLCTHTYRNAAGSGGDSGTYMETVVCKYMYTHMHTSMQLGIDETVVYTWRKWFVQYIYSHTHTGMQLGVGETVVYIWR